MERKHLSVILALLIFLGILILLISARSESHLELPHIPAGKKINSLQLRSETGDIVTLESQMEKQVSLLFLFAKRCPTCEYNVNYWKKLGKELGQNVNTLGIIMSNARDLISISKSKKLNFRIYSPVNKEKVENEFEIKFYVSQTIILQGETVVFSKGGDLSVEDYFEIKKIIQEELK